MKRKLTCTNYFIIFGKKRFSREYTKNPNANVRALRRHILGCWISFPPGFQLAFHICYVKYENTLTCERISWNSGGNDVLKIFFYFLYV